MWRYNNVKCEVDVPIYKLYFEKSYLHLPILGTYVHMQCFLLYTWIKNFHTSCKIAIIRHDKEMYKL